MMRSVVARTSRINLLFDQAFSALTNVKAGKMEPVP
jgi:hypothetical protein